MKNTHNVDNQLLEVQKILTSHNPQLAEKFRTLCNIIEDYQSGIIAFSGGVDSSLLAYLSHHLLNESLAVTADSPTLPRAELLEAQEFAKKYNLNHRIISHNELEDDNFKMNDERRCFYCKDGLFEVLNGIKGEENLNCVIDGSNYDDLDDYRPGREAAKKNNVKSPLIEAEMAKEDIRAVSRALALTTWNKPQMACLSSRFPRNVPIDEENLKKVEEAESVLKKAGYRDVRVRFHGEIARIEIGKGEELDLEELRKLVPKIKELGFRYITLDLEGYRTGSLNE